jgi:hypothetical protein
VRRNAYKREINKLGRKMKEEEREAEEAKESSTPPQKVRRSIRRERRKI